MPECQLLETALYVGDLPRSREFYSTLFGFEVMTQDDRFCAFSVPGRGVLLLFLQGATRSAVASPGGLIPPHDGSGQTHLAFAIAANELPVWEARLAEQGVPLESRVTWPRGGTSLYFRDPDEHLVELATPGVWPIY
ncbi:MAG: VOC family protein [Planctomycetes bacterium]|nr:VOC family protein [Planctomycetota bacterium]